MCSAAVTWFRMIFVKSSGYTVTGRAQITKMLTVHDVENTGGRNSLSRTRIQLSHKTSPYSRRFIAKTSAC